MRNFIKDFKEGVRGFGENITVIINTFLLLIVYIVGVGVTSVFAKIINKHFLEVKKNEGSYWSDLDLKKKPMEEYYRQF